MSELLAFPLSRTAPLAPPPALAALREQGPAQQVQMWTGDPAWLVTRFEEVRAALSDANLTSDTTAPGYPTFSPARRAYFTTERDRIILLEGAEHAQLRRLVARALTVKKVEDLRPVVRNLITSLLDDIIAKGPTTDLIQSFCLKIPSTVICALLGIPYEDHRIFEELTRKRVNINADPAEVVAASAAMKAHFEMRVREREESPTGGDDFLSRLVEEHIPAGTITRERAIKLMYELVEGGHETTANVMGLGILLLLTNPEQLALLKANPDLVRPGVEEILRYTGVTHMAISRAARGDTKIGDQEIKAGESVLLSIYAASHDPRAFLDPEKFEIDKGTRDHLAFSFGIHQCVGQQLARMELNEVFSTLFHRLPTLALAVPLDSLKFKLGSVVYGVESLPVTW